MSTDRTESIACACTIALVLGLIAGWTFAFVIPNDAHMERVGECLEKRVESGRAQNDREGWVACHNEHVADAGGLVSMVYPPR